MDELTPEERERIEQQEREEKIAALERAAYQRLLPFLAPAATIVGRAESAQDHDDYAHETVLVAMELRGKVVKAAKDYAQSKIDNLF